MFAWLRSRRLSVAAFLVFLGAAAGLQWLGRAYGADIAGDPDEPAHYVTGLMTRDYIAAGMPWPPMRFAEVYYAHYPKVAMGHWPPGFYVVEAAWMLAFSASQASILVCLAAISALAALLLYRETSRRFDVWVSMAAGVVFLSLPPVVVYTRTVMSEMLMCVLAVLAVSRFGRYLDTGEWRHNAWFGVWASLAILVKGTGFVLALVPVFALLAGRYFRLARRWHFWLPAPIVAAVCGPWYALAPKARHEDVVPYGGLGFRPVSMLHFAWHWYMSAGIGVTIFAAIGIAYLLARGWKERMPDGQTIAFAAFLGGFAVFRSLVAAAGNLRTMTLALPFLLFFAVAGLDGCLAGLRAQGRIKGAVWAGLAILAVTVNVRSVSRAPRFGFSQAAQAMCEDAPAASSVMLVSSDSTGEGSLIAEVAMRDRRPGHTVLRASKALYSSNWNGHEYRLLYRTPAEVAAFLDREGVQAVLVDRSTRKDAEDRRLLLAALDEGGGYQRLRPGWREGRELEIYIARAKVSYAPAKTCHTKKGTD